MNLDVRRRLGHFTLLIFLQSEPLYFSGRRLRQAVVKPDRPGVFERRDRCFDVILKTFDAFGVGGDARSQHDMRFDNLAALDVRGSDHATFGDVFVRK